MCTVNTTMKSGQTCPGVQMGRPSDVMVASPGCSATIRQDWSPYGAGMGTRLTASPSTVGVLQRRPLNCRMSQDGIGVSNVLPLSA